MVTGAFKKGSKVRKPLTDMPVREEDGVSRSSASVSDGSVGHVDEGERRAGVDPVPDVEEHGAVVEDAEAVAVPSSDRAAAAVVESASEVPDERYEFGGRQVMGVEQQPRHVQSTPSASRQRQYAYQPPQPPYGASEQYAQPAPYSDGRPWYPQHRTRTPVRQISVKITEEAYQTLRRVTFEQECTMQAAVDAAIRYAYIDRHVDETTIPKEIR